MTMQDGYSYATVAQNINLLMREGKPRTQAAAIAYAHARVSYFNRFPHGALPEWIAFPHNKRLRQHYGTFGEPLVSVTGREVFNDNPRRPGTLTLWKYNTITGYWIPERVVTEETAGQWLQIFKQDDVEAFYTVSKKRPTNNPFKRNPRIASSKRQTRAIADKFVAGDIAKAKQLYRDFTGHEPASMRKVRIKELPKAGLVFGQLVQVGYRSARDGQLYRHTFRSNKSRPLLVASFDGKQVLIVGGRYAFTDRGIEDR